MDVEFECPNCHRRNFLMLQRSDWDKKHFKRCIWPACRKGFSVQVKVAKVADKDIERFLEEQKKKPKTSGPGYSDKTTKGEGGISIDSAPTD